LNSYTGGFQLIDIQLFFAQLDANKQKNISMSKIKDMMELNFWLGNRSQKAYNAVMQNRRFLPKDRESIKQELDRAKRMIRTDGGSSPMLLPKSFDS
jgi:hypothetical protein